MYPLCTSYLCNWVISFLLKIAACERESLWKMPLDIFTSANVLFLAVKSTIRSFHKWISFLFTSSDIFSSMFSGSYHIFFINNHATFSSLFWSCVGFTDLFKVGLLFLFFHCGILICSSGKIRRHTRESQISSFMCGEYFPYHR